MADGLLVALALNVLAELGDKSQLAVFALSAKYKRPWHVFAGAFIGQILATILAIFIGVYALQTLPFALLKTVSGALFLALGAWLLLKAPVETTQGVAGVIRTGAFLPTLGTIFLAEMGDKSQVTNLLLATQYDVWTVLAGSMIAFAALIAVATLVGHRVAHSKWAGRVRYAAGGLFTIIGIATLLL